MYDWMHETRQNETVNLSGLAKTTRKTSTISDDTDIGLASQVKACFRKRHGDVWEISVKRVLVSMLRPGLNVEYPRLRNLSFVMQSRYCSME